MENNKFDKAVPEKVDELSKYIGDLMVNMSQGEDVSLQQCIAFLSLVITRVFASFVVLNGVSTIYAKKIITSTVSKVITESFNDYYHSALHYYNKISKV